MVLWDALRIGRSSAMCWIVAITCCAAGGIARADEAADAKQIQEFVFSCQHAGFERGDLAAYMKQWSDDARLIAGRGEKEDKLDVALNRKQIEATRRLRLSALPEGGFKITYLEPKVTLDGDQAVLRVTMVAKWDDDQQEIREGETYRLRRTKEGWRVTENRGWPLLAKERETTRRYDAATWKKLDAEVEAAEKTGDTAALVNALNEAYRFAEALKTVRKLTAVAGAVEAEWLQHGWIALSAGDADEAEKAFRAALKLDPSAAVPSVLKPRKSRTDR